MVLTYQQLLLGHSIVSRRDRGCEKCVGGHDDDDAVRGAQGGGNSQIVGRWCRFRAASLDMLA
jgi:hypothetical protein